MVSGAMSIEAAYVRAASSSHLEWKPTLADIDYLMAAGLVRDSLATRLIRLRADFDSVSASTERRVLMPMLRGFRETTEYLLAHARKEAEQQRDPLADDAVTAITCKVLDLFLDPNCPSCDGRGFTGTYGAPMIRCPACRETGKRSAYWRSDREEQFARWLQSTMDFKLTRALVDMRRALR